MQTPSPNPSALAEQCLSQISPSDPSTCTVDEKSKKVVDVHFQIRDLPNPYEALRLEQGEDFFQTAQNYRGLGIFKTLVNAGLITDLNSDLNGGSIDWSRVRCTADGIKNKVCPNANKPPNPQKYRGSTEAVKIALQVARNKNADSRIISALQAEFDSVNAATRLGNYLTTQESAFEQKCKKERPPCQDSLNQFKKAFGITDPRPIYITWHAPGHRASHSETPPRVAARIAAKEDTGDSISSPFSPLVDPSLFGFGGTKYQCPAYLPQMNCIAEKGKWVVEPPQSPANAPLTQPQIDSAFQILEPQLLGALNESAIVTSAETYVIGTLADPKLLSPVSQAKARLEGAKTRFLAKATCLSAEAKAKVSTLFDQALSKSTENNVQTLRLALETHRAKLAIDLAESSKALTKARTDLARLKPEFETKAKCGFISDRLNPDRKLKNQCNQDLYELRARERTIATVLANYPILGTPSHSNEIKYLDMGAEIAADPTPANAIAIHDKTVKTQIDAILDRVGERCEAPLTEAAKDLFNPVIARAFVEENPSSAWVFCASYAKLSQNEKLKDLGAKSFLAVSFLITDGLAGLVIGGLSLTNTTLNAIDRHRELEREQKDFIAGVGDVALYLKATDELENFYPSALLDVGLDLLALAPEARMLKTWAKADELAKLGKLKALPETTRKTLTTWYRSRISRAFGPIAEKLSDAKLAVMARLEAKGIHLDYWRKVAGCPL